MNADAEVRKELAPYKFIMKKYLVEHDLWLRYGVGPQWTTETRSVTVRRRAPSGSLVGKPLIQVLGAPGVCPAIATVDHLPSALRELDRYLRVTIAERATHGDK